jgi:hypothetical protein
MVVPVEKVRLLGSGSRLSDVLIIILYRFSQAFYEALREPVQVGIFVS